jgi:protein-disulfide isomerase
MRGAAILGVASLVALLWSQQKSALDKKTLEAYVRHLQLYPEGVKIAISDPKPSEVPGLVEVTTTATLGQASEQRSYFVSRDGSRIIEGTAYAIAQNPFKKNLDRLKTEFRPSFGTPGAPVVVAMFSDFQCSFCKQEAEAVRRELLKAYPTQVRAYFLDFPLTQIHPWSMDAALAGRCVFNQDALAFWDYHDWAFAKQAELTVENFKARRDEFLKSKSMDPAAIDRCVAGPAAKKAVDAAVQMGRDLGVNSTPTLFVNGRKLGGYVPWENLRQIIGLEVGYQATANNAGEKCCSLPAPSAIPTQPNPMLPQFGTKKQ